MKDFHPWHGYLVASEGDCHYICSTWQLGEQCVFGYDSDYTTMAVALIKFLTAQEHPVILKAIDEKISIDVLAASTEHEIADSGYTLSCNSDASLAMFLDDAPVVAPPTEAMKAINPETYSKINHAWDEESNERNISQGAYISGQQYSENLESRLSLTAQNHDVLIWPQRQMDADGVVIEDNIMRLKPTGTVTSWTKLSAAGAPSEFAIRAPILGGIATVMVQTTDGPNGVFLLVDDDTTTPEIGASVDLVVRRLYAQEGSIRYGLKAILKN